MIEPDIGRRILTRAVGLAFPRYPGSPGDHKAIAMVADHLTASGLEVSVEEFSYDLSLVWKVLRAVLLLAAVTVALAGLAVARAPVLSLLLLLVTVAGCGSLLLWSPWLERLYSGPGPTVTANVCGRRPSPRPRMTLIMLAHHDSKSQNLTMLARGALTLLAVLSAASVAAQAVGVVSGALVAAQGWPTAVGFVGGASLLVLSTLRSGNLSPGGVDNAGSLAVVLELADTLPRQVEDDVELIFLSPGAEEDHMVGAMRWLEAHQEEFDGRPVLALNLDGVGAPGRLVLLERYGFGRLFSPRLSRLARDVARDQGLEPRGVLLPPAMGIDAIPFVHRGIECLTLSSGSLDRATLAVHSRHDTAEHLSGEVLSQAFLLASEMIRRLASHASVR